MISSSANLKLAEHCSGDCSEEEINAARDQCTAEYESSNPGAQCDCHCHGAEGTEFILLITLQADLIIS